MEGFWNRRLIVIVPAAALAAIHRFKRGNAFAVALEGCRRRPVRKQFEDADILHQYVNLSEDIAVIAGRGRSNQGCKLHEYRQSSAHLHENKGRSAG